MLQNLLNTAIENAKKTGNHIQYEMDEVAQAMTVDEISDLAEELGNYRMKAQVKHYRNGNHRGHRGNAKAHLVTIRQMAFGHLNSLNMKNSMD